MDQRSCRVLILDTDPDTLIVLQHLLEHADIDTTITWDKTEACGLLETEHFDLLLLSDHPPELDAAAILRDFRPQGARCRSLILRAIVRQKDVEYYCGLGAIGVVTKRDPLLVLEQVVKALAPVRFKASTAETGFSEARSWRAAS